MLYCPVDLCCFRVAKVKLSFVLCFSKGVCVVTSEFLIHYFWSLSIASIATAFCLYFIFCEPIMHITTE